MFGLGQVPYAFTVLLLSFFPRGSQKLRKQKIFSVNEHRKVKVNDHKLCTIVKVNGSITMYNSLFFKQQNKKDLSRVIQQIGVCKVSQYLSPLASSHSRSTYCHSQLIDVGVCLHCLKMLKTLSHEFVCNVQPHSMYGMIQSRYNTTITYMINYFIQTDSSLAFCEMRARSLQLK